MINNEMTTVTLIHYSSTPDSYGQMKTAESQTSIKMMLKIYSKEHTTNPEFTSIEYIGLTESTVNEGDDIQVGSKKYKVFSVIPSRKYNRVLLSGY